MKQESHQHDPGLHCRQTTETSAPTTTGTLRCALVELHRKYDEHCEETLHHGTGVPHSTKQS